MYEQRRLLCIPLNEQGVIDLDYDKKTKNNVYIPFPPEEYKYMMFDTNLFNTINIECDLLIDDFEEDTIQNENISIIEKIVKGHEKNIPTFINALNIARENKTFVEIIL